MTPGVLDYVVTQTQTQALYRCVTKVMFDRALPPPSPGFPEVQSTVVIYPGLDIPLPKKNAAEGFRVCRVIASKLSNSVVSV